MLGAALSLAPWCRTVFVLFPDKGKSRAFERQLQSQGAGDGRFEKGHSPLTEDRPWFRRG
jgi:hypothetical protein